MKTKVIDSWEGVPESSGGLESIDILEIDQVIEAAQNRFGDLITAVEYVNERYPYECRCCDLMWHSLISGTIVLGEHSFYISDRGQSSYGSIQITYCPFCGDYLTETLNILSQEEE